MSLRTRVERLESQWETDDLVASLRAWISSLPLDAVRCLAAFTETDEPSPEERHEMTRQDAYERAYHLLDKAPEEIRRAYLPKVAERERDN